MSKKDKHIHNTNQGKQAKSKQNNSSNPQISKSKLVFYFALIIPIIITWLTYISSLKNGFVSWDDEGYLMDNLKVIGNFSTDGWKYIFTHYNMANYHPITLMIYNFLYNACQFNPEPYHTFNLIFHLVNVGLVFYLITKLTEKKYTVAFIVALLFGIHPLHVESVAWVSETKDVIYTFFFILSLLAYIKYDNQKTNFKFYAIALILFILSCLSKGMAVSLPVILVLIDYLKKKQFTKEIIVEKIPFFLVSIIIGIVAIKAQVAADGMYNLSSYSVFEKILFPFYAVFFYIYKMIIPANLAILYPYPAHLTFEYFIAPLIIIGIAIGVYVTKKSTRKVVFGTLFFAACITPIIQILPVGASIASDRYFYLSSIGLFYLIAEGIYYLYYEKFKLNTSARTGIIVSSLIVCIVFINCSVQRIKVWENTFTLWTDLSITNPKVDKAWYGLGLFIQRQGESSKDNNERQSCYNMAKKQYLKALEQNPGNLKALNNLGNCYYNSVPAQIDSAYSYYQKLLKLDTTYANVYHNLGNIYANKNQMNKAIWAYNKAISLDKNFSISYFGLGYVYTVLKDEQKANENYIKAAQLGYADAQKIVTSKNLKY